MSGVHDAGGRPVSPLRRLRTIVWSLLLVALAALFVTAARNRDFWHDEVYVVLLSSLPLARLWSASIDGADLGPPLSSAVAHFVHSVVSPGPVATRLPAMTGFLVAVAAAGAIARRRGGEIAAWSAAFALVSTTALSYAVEARGYGMSLGLFSLALYGWSEAAAGRSRRRNLALMAASLAAGFWAHYFLVLAFVPVALGEAVRQWRLRRIDPAPWLALAIAGVACLPAAWLGWLASAQRSGFWAQPSLTSIAGVYRWIPASFHLPHGVTVLLAALAVVHLARGRRNTDIRYPAHEVAAGLACLALPAAAVALGRVVHAFDARYATFTCVGLAIVAPLAVAALAPARRLASLVLLAGLAWTAGRAGHAMATMPALWRDLYASRPVLASALATGERVVIAGGADWLPLWYYAPEASRDRAVYVADPAMQLRETGSDTIDRGYLALARWVDLPVEAAGEFLAGTKRFRVYSTGPSWTLAAIAARGATLVEVAREPGDRGILYEAEIR